MVSSSLAFVASERAALADLCEEVGPDAPTCCAGWTTAHLAAHVVVRDRRLDAQPGYAAEAFGRGDRLAAWAHGVEDHLRTTTPYAEVVSRARSGPPVWLAAAWPPVARLINTTELAIHHEDVPRAQPDWAPRQLTTADQDALWSAAALYARRGAGSRGLVLR